MEECAAVSSPLLSASADQPHLVPAAPPFLARLLILIFCPPTASSSNLHARAATGTFMLQVEENYSRCCLASLEYAWHDNQYQPNQA